MKWRIEALRHGEPALIMNIRGNWVRWDHIPKADVRLFSSLEEAAKIIVLRELDIPTRTLVAVENSP